MAEKLEQSEHQTTLVSSHHELDDFVSAVKGQKLLVLDAEGVDLSRTGKATLVTVGVNDGVRVRVFLFDLIDETAEYSTRLLSILKEILEDSSTIKIIHDCRQDSDSLNEFFGIKLAGVFDTSIYHMMVNNTESRENLNNTLGTYGCDINPNRKPRDFYNQHPNYWADRPLTEDHIACASADVSSLFELREKLLERVTDKKADKMKNSSEEALDEFRSLRYCDNVPVPQYQVGRVIGHRGSNIVHIEKTTGAKVSRNSKGGFVVMAKDQAALDSAKRIILRKASG
jgi:ribonuclease D